MVHQQSEQLQQLAVKFFEINAVKFGDFETKSGVRTPIYFDLRVIISHPDVMVSEYARRVTPVAFARNLFRNFRLL